NAAAAIESMFSIDVISNSDASLVGGFSAAPREIPHRAFQPQALTVVRPSIRGYTDCLSVQMNQLDHQQGDQAMNVDDNTIDDWLRLIQAEYLEMPCLQLTRAQVRRLWALDPELCDALLDVLVGSEFLRKTDHQTYVLATGAFRNVAAGNPAQMEAV